MHVLIKRYANRKLYNTHTSRYITLKGIAELIEAGDEIRVIDNETGEDITSVALSQILVDNERTSQRLPGTVLTELIQRGGDVLYNVLRKRVGEASEGLEGLQRSVRRMVAGADAGGEPLRDWIAFATPDLEHVMQSSVERVLKLLDLPTREDIRALDRKLERVAIALEKLELPRAEPPRAEPTEPDVAVETES
ncbi:MAG: hypothetical protein JSU66_04375 [Deltaproteobacteria bacterium]|nr:MAG: hypothetical protein JSU66_04375 [Deltaproteobacteria bacterium]